MMNRSCLPLEARQERILNVELLSLYYPRAELVTLLDDILQTRDQQQVPRDLWGVNRWRCEPCNLAWLRQVWDEHPSGYEPCVRHISGYEPYEVLPA